MKDLKGQSIKYEPLNKWFGERNEPDPKFLYIGDGTDGKLGRNVGWLLLNNNKKGFIIVSSKKNENGNGFIIGDKLLPYKLLNWGLLEPGDCDFQFAHTNSITSKIFDKNQDLFTDQLQRFKK